MPRVAKQWKLLNLAVAAIMLLIAAGGVLWRNCQMSPRQLTVQRPAGAEGFVFDYAGILEPPVKQLDLALEDLLQNHAIETIVVTFAKQPQEMALEHLGQQLFENWQIGGSHDGRGILLLVAAESRQIQVSVGPGLKEIYNADFCNRIQTGLWPALADKGRISEALTQAVAEILNRAQLTPAGPKQTE